MKRFSCPHAAAIAARPRPASSGNARGAFHGTVRRRYCRSEPCNTGKVGACDLRNNPLES